MTKEFDALGSLKIEFGIPCINILFLDTSSIVNAHGTMTLKVIIPAEVSQEDILRCEDTPITLTRQTGEVVFSGMVTRLKLEHNTQYQELLITACSYSCMADRDRKSETFQGTGKTLGQVIHAVMDPCGVKVTIPNDIPVSQMLSRNNETPWEFTVRIANEQGLYVYSDSKSLEPHISIGLEPFSTFPYDCFVLEREEKDIYAMTGRDYTVSDGSMYFLPREQQETAYLNTGYVSEAAADGTCPPSLAEGTPLRDCRTGRRRTRRSEKRPRPLQCRCCRLPP